MEVELSAWKGKYVIGLSGNIGTGKSTVRRMLEHLSAYGIDADALAHRAIAKGAPGYQKVIDIFGKWVLQNDGEIDRKKLGKIVFSDPQALETLEAIVHPLVDQAIDILIRRARQQVIVIEAIKLIETNLAAKCDEIWIVHASKDIRIQRLIQKRGLSKTDALQRINAQDSQETKLAAADVVINNSSDFNNTWNQVLTEWERIAHQLSLIVPKPASAKQGFVHVHRARPKQASEIAEIIAGFDPKRKAVTADDIMAEFAEKAFLIAELDDKTIGIAGWKVENLISTTDDLFVDNDLPIRTTLYAIMGEIEKASIELQCEVSLISLPQDSSRMIESLQDIDYELTTLEEINVRVWKEAAFPLIKSNRILLLKKLRKDRVMRPV